MERYDRITIKTRIIVEDNKYFTIAKDHIDLELANSFQEVEETLNELLKKQMTTPSYKRRIGKDAFVMRTLEGVQTKNIGKITKIFTYARVYKPLEYDTDYGRDFENARENLIEQFKK